MTRICGIEGSSLILLLAGLAACASQPVTGTGCNLATPSTAGWTTHDEGRFTVQLPPTYTRVEVQGIDSQVGRWTADGRSVSYDLGFYSNSLQPNEINTFPGLEVCQESGGRDTPRIIRYRPAAGGYAVSAHWPDLWEENGMTVSLTLEGVVEQSEDQGELLAIIRSVTIEPR